MPDTATAAASARRTKRSGVEPPWLLRSLPYSEYRQSNWWRQRRDLYTELVVHRYGCKTCELCDLSDAWFEEQQIPLRFNVHHITYLRLGAEHDEDLVLLCSPCHNLIHRPDSEAARHWARHTDPTLAERAQRFAHIDDE